MYKRLMKKLQISIPLSINFQVKKVTTQYEREANIAPSAQWKGGKHRTGGRRFLSAFSATNTAAL
jgi:hypothetical protein